MHDFQATTSNTPCDECHIFGQRVKTFEAYNGVLVQASQVNKVTRWLTDQADECICIQGYAIGLPDLQVPVQTQMQAARVGKGMVLINRHIHQAYPQYVSIMLILICVRMCAYVSIRTFWVGTTGLWASLHPMGVRAPSTMRSTTRGQGNLLQAL